MGDAAARLTVFMRDQFGAAATDRIVLDASRTASADIFGFFNGTSLSAEVTMRKEGSCANIRKYT